MCYDLLPVHLGIFIVNNQLDTQLFFSYMFISVLYMFRAAMCSSSGESIVSIRHLVYVTLCRWPTSMQAWMDPSLHTRRSPTQSDIYQMSYWYNWLSWWWAHCCSKHVENWNKHIRKNNCVSSWLFTRNYIILSWLMLTLIRVTGTMLIFSFSLTTWHKNLFILKY